MKLSTTFILAPLFFALFFSSMPSAKAQEFQYPDRYTIFQDLLSLENDAIEMQIFPPLISDTATIYQMPAVVPGTYKVHNYGLFIRDFLALNSQGDTLPVTRLDLNSWQISKANELYFIKYKVEDSFDAEDGKHIFPPSGSSNEQGAFLLNQFAYIGYLIGYEDLDFHLKINHPKDFYGAGAWTGERTDSLDSFVFSNYFDLHDNPFLYAPADTISISLGQTLVELAVFSPNKKLRADSTMRAVREVLEASALYLGGDLPVDKYSILIYCEQDMEGQLSYGALEHHRSTVLYMPEMMGKDLYQSIRDIVAHEFLHIITPLGIHSEYIADFNFADPEMSQHLWLYEGVTEYNSHLVQVRDSLYDLEEFLLVLRDKFLNNDQYEQVPLTVASEYTLDLYPDNYQNFYDGGAIAAMALDLYLIEQTNGEMRLVDLLMKMQAAFPADTFFVDDDLFKIMADYSFPWLEGFMVRHFKAGEAFPWENLFSVVGIEYQETGVAYGWSLGCDEFSYDLEQGRFIIASEEGIDEFGEDLGLELLDQIVSINGDTMAIYNFQDILEKFQNETKAGDEIEMVIARQKKKEGFKMKVLKAKAVQIEYEESHQIRLNPKAEEWMIKNRQFWLKQ